MPIKWDSSLNTGIKAIDKQHMRIVEYINRLEEAHLARNIKQIGEVLDACVDYTQSHFAFEESVQQQAGYEFLKPHKKVHDLFIRRINVYQERFRHGEDIAAELLDLLSHWLINHIKQDDADYVSAVKQNMINVIENNEKKAVGWLSRFFKARA